MALTNHTPMSLNRLSTYNYASMRTFLAVEVSSEVVAKRLVDVQKKISLSGADVKHVEPQNLHFTVKFLGELGEGQAKQIWDKLYDLNFTQVHVTYRGVGVFPKPSRISVIWIGIDHEGGEKLVSIAKTVEERLKTFNIGDERPFQPHLTITRVRSSRNKDRLSDVVQSLQDSLFGDDVLTSLKMKKSELTPKGPIYTDIYTLPFKVA